MKLWKGRFSKRRRIRRLRRSTLPLKRTKDSINRISRAAMAHALMLGRQGIISMEEAEAIRISLREILEDIENGKVEFTIEQEDIHMNIETLLTQRIGDAGKKLHTARSRNDQVATDLRLYQKEEIHKVQALLQDLIDTLENLAEEHKETVMPGYTHLQRAQPVTLAMHLCAYVEMFKRDLDRFRTV